MSEAPAYDVAIVGYGPAGVVAAGLLGQAGFSVYVCERLRGVYQIPRAIALDHEIMRVFQQLGVVEAIRPFCEPFTPSEYFGVDGHLIRRMTMVAPPYPQGYTPSIVFTQPQIERVLRERVAQLPNVVVAEGVECSALAQDEEGVTLTVASVPVRARWVIGCDGGSSTVRELAGITLDDLEFDEPWLVVDVLCNERGLAKLPKTSVQYCEPERPCTLVIGPGNHRRWEISLKPGEYTQQAASTEGTWAHLSRWLTPEDGTLWRQASYRFHALVASRWRAGRVFVAGDAAHMQPPFLGQGMCQGIRDVMNLCWKLESVLRNESKGEAAERLLDSYGLERQGHVRELTSRLKAIGAVIGERDLAKARARDARLLAECGGVVKDTPRQDVVIDNKPGGQNTIGAQAAARATADGLNFYFATTAALVTNPLLFKSLPYDPTKDFVPVAFIARSPFAVLVDANSPLKTLNDLIARSKADQGKFSIGNEGPRTFSGMIARLFNARTQAGANLVPYSSVGVGTQNLMGGHVDAMVADLASTAALAKQGKLRVLATTSAKRVPGWENVPALAETLPGFDMVGWFAIVAPAGTPAAVIERVNRDLNTVLNDKEVAERIATIGPITDGSMSVEAVGAFLRDESARWAAVTREIGVLPE